MIQYCIQHLLFWLNIFKLHSIRVIRMHAFMNGSVALSWSGIKLFTLDGGSKIFLPNSTPNICKPLPTWILTEIPPTSYLKVRVSHVPKASTFGHRGGCFTESSNLGTCSCCLLSRTRWTRWKRRCCRPPGQHPHQRIIHGTQKGKALLFKVISFFLCV